MASPAAARRRVSFPSMVMRVLAALHLPFALAAGEAARLSGAPYPFAIGLSLAALLLLPLRFRIGRIIEDRPLAPLVRVLLVEPYDLHLCATMFAALPTAAVTLIDLSLDLLLGRPFFPPATFALALHATFLLIGVYAIWVRRHWVRTRRIDVPIAGLPAAFEGFTIAHVSDLHVGGLTGRRQLDRWVRIVNGGKPDIVAVTGDLLTSGERFIDDAAALIARFEGRDGVFVSMGNHDYFGDGVRLVAAMRERGLKVLRNESMRLERGGQGIDIAGVDDTWTGRADVDRALSGTRGPVVLLAHDPKVFDEAARNNVELTLSGHTHAGQLAMPFFVAKINMARIAYPYTYGIYHHGRSTLYVHAGLGTTGPPARLGAAPEVVFLRLVAG